MYELRSKQLPSFFQDNSFPEPAEREEEDFQKDEPSEAWPFPNRIEDDPCLPSDQLEGGELLARKAIEIPEEDLVFEEPSVLGKPGFPVAYRIPKDYQALPKKTILHFRGNYRRFLLLLFFGLLLASPVIYLSLRWLGFLFPLRYTLAGLTGTGGLSCLVFYLAPYQKRGITLDHFGIYYEDELRDLYIAWQEIEELHLHAVEAFFNPYPLCYVRIVTSSKEEFAFANFGNHLFGIRRKISFGNPPYPIIDVRDADLLLLLISQQARWVASSPDLKRLRFRAQTDLTPEEEEEEILELEEKPKQEPKQRWLGFWALFLKLGTKILAPLAKVLVKAVPYLPKGGKVLLQSVKPLYAGVSLGLYAMFFTWQFAVLLTIILIVHELGHVWAMYRSGMKIRGVYMIPFFGAATVTDDSWPSWYAQAKVNLEGPLWGTYCTILCLVIYLFHPSPFWIALALWGALINFLNMLPIQPLDGGRVLNAVAYSLKSRVGFIVTILILTGGVMLSLSLELMLLYILCMFGLMEFFKEYMLRQRVDKFSLVDDYKLITPRESLLFKSITGINLGIRNTPHVLENEEIHFKRLRLVLHAPRMTQKQLWKVSITAVLMTFSLFGLLLILQIAYPQEAAWAIRLFR